MSSDDPPVGSDEVLGKVTEVQRSGSVFLPARRLSPFRRLLAYLFCHWGLLRRLGLRVWAGGGESHRQGTFVRAAS